MTRREIFLLAAGLALGTLIGLAYIFTSDRVAQRKASTEARQVGVGYPAPDFTLEGLDGKPATLADFRGKALVLNFWATWCTPCKAEMPMLNEYAGRYADELVVVGLNYGESKEFAQGFVTENGITFPILLDPSSSTGADYMIRGFPTTYFIDSEGVLRSLHIGQLSQALLDEYLQTIGVAP
ncbi:MAG TPA: TlpA disulfide reductase family protein [Anaerolineaceae bacterium]